MLERREKYCDVSSTRQYLLAQHSIGVIVLLKLHILPRSHRPQRYQHVRYIPLEFRNLHYTDFLQNNSQKYQRMSNPLASNSRRHSYQHPHHPHLHPPLHTSQHPSPAHRRPQTTRRRSHHSTPSRRYRHRCSHHKRYPSERK
jgi:hypothetical protein